MRRWLSAALIALFLVTACGKAKSQQQQAQDWITKVGSDARSIQELVQQVQTATRTAAATTTPATLQGLANVAQTAHDALATYKSEYALSGVSGQVGNAVLGVFAAVNDLKNAMGGIVAYTGDPNPATAAKMTSQYQSAVQEWNSAVDTIWTAAGQDNPPDL